MHNFDLGPRHVLGTQLATEPARRAPCTASSACRPSEHPNLSETPARGMILAYGSKWHTTGTPRGGARAGAPARCSARRRPRLPGGTSSRPTSANRKANGSPCPVSGRSRSAGSVCTRTGTGKGNGGHDFLPGPGLVSLQPVIRAGKIANWPIPKVCAWYNGQACTSSAHCSGYHASVANRQEI